jgi:hypothetical protein
MTSELGRKKGMRKNLASLLFSANRGGGIRTPDLSVPNRALYQAEPRPGRLVIIHASRMSSTSPPFNLHTSIYALLTFNV